MRKFIEVGETYGVLTVVVAGIMIDGASYAICRCLGRHERPRLVVVRHSGLQRGGTKSCGCSRARRVSRAKGPDPSTAREYASWSGAKQRCYNHRSPSYKHYGGRGITMSEEWRASFAAFYRDMGPRPSPQHSLDRIDNDGPYSKDNCRWATPAEQALNTRRHRVVAQRDGDWKRRHRYDGLLLEGFGSECYLGPPGAASSAKGNAGGTP